MSDARGPRRTVGEPFKFTEHARARLGVVEKTIGAGKHGKDAHALADLADGAVVVR